MRPPGKKGPKAHGAGSAKKRRGGAAARGTNDASSFNQPLNNWNVSSVYVGLSESDEESDSE